MLRKAIVFVLFVAACAPSMTPRSNSREEVAAYVNRAADLVAKEGAAACATLQQRNWFSGDWYIFMFDEQGRTVCHPARPEMVGTMAAALQDPNGKKFGDEFMRIGLSETGGWVSYAWARPRETTPTPKSAFVRSVRAPDGKRFVVGSGGYELQ